MIDLTQTGHSSITVKVGGEPVSTHSTWHRAVVSAYEQVKGDPSRRVTIVTNQEVRVTYSPRDPEDPEDPEEPEPEWEVSGWSDAVTVDPS